MPGLSTREEVTRLSMPRSPEAGEPGQAAPRARAWSWAPVRAAARQRDKEPTCQRTPLLLTDGTEFIAAASDGAYTLVVADFADTATAWSAYEALEAAEDGRTVEIEGVVVVKREADGKLEVQKATDHSTKSGLKWGLVGGIALGVIFPPSILGSAAALGAAGAATGKVRQLHHRSELADQLEGSIAPGHSGILALVSDPGAVEIRKALAAADAIVAAAIDDVAARDIKAAAKEAEAEDKS